MTRKLLFLTISAVAGLSASGCDKAKCETICEPLVDCALENAKERDSSCEWKRGTDAVREDCVAACESAYAGLSAREQEDVDECVACYEAERHGSCDADDIHDAKADCKSDCDVEGTEEFGKRYEEANDDPELTCGGNSADDQPRHTGGGSGFGTFGNECERAYEKTVACWRSIDCTRAAETSTRDICQSVQDIIRDPPTVTVTTTTDATCDGGALEQAERINSCTLDTSVSDVATLCVCK